jgi:alpha-1,2-mannosyltransferase
MSVVRRLGRPAWSPAAETARPRTRAGPVIVGATALALGLRLFLVTRPGFLTSGTVEYDDGVYLGTAMRLLHGALPYRDYAFVQPPGIAVVAVPAAVVGSLTSQAAGLAVARVATALASTACVALAGRLVRHRGPLVAGVTCGVLAVYPADVLAGRTLLLEPWMNLCVLLAAGAAFRDGRLASPRRLAWAGAALGCGAAIKYWAAIPALVLLAVCLIDRSGEAATGAQGWSPDLARRRAAAVLGGTAGGFAVLAGPFIVAAPVAFVRETLGEQLSRVGVPTPLSLRLAHLTGLIAVLGRDGKIAGSGNATYSLFALGADASTHIVAVGWPAFAAAAMAVTLLAAGYLRAPRQRSPLEWFALATGGLATVAILSYSAFFYHYPDFPAPWLAIAVGAAAGALSTPDAAGPAGGVGGVGAEVAADRVRRGLAALTAVAILAVAGLETYELAPASVPVSPRAAALIPAGSCLVADQISFAIAAGEFAAPRPGCPDVVDSLAVTLALSGGVSPQGGAGKQPKVIAGWEAIFGKAQYVWLSGQARQRIPWNHTLRTWFGGHFRELAALRGYGDSKIYVRDR